MSILITGGAGLIGSNLVKVLCRAGEAPFVADNLWRGKLENLHSNGQPLIDLESKFFQVDLQDLEQCRYVTRNVDTVVHLADIVAGINYVFSNELFLFRANNLINSNMLNASIENGVKRFLYVGTACSYPVERQSSVGGPLLKEEDAYPANPESAYGWSKLIGEYECALAEKEGKIDMAVLRFHNVYGPPAELSADRSQVIPALCRKAICYPKEPFIVWGTGTQRRAFLFVEDAVDAIIRALDRGMGKGVIQIGPSESVSIAEVARKIVTLSGKAIEIEFDTSKPEGDKDRVGDTSKARIELGWMPRVGLEQGLGQTYRWAKKHLQDS